MRENGVAAMARYNDAMVMVGMLQAICQYDASERHARTVVQAEENKSAYVASSVSSSICREATN